MLSLAIGVISGAATSTASAQSGDGVWHPTGAMLEAHQQTRVATLANGWVLALFEDEGNLGSELYDSSTGLWTPGPTAPTPRASTLVPLADGGALLIGETVCPSPDSLPLVCSPTNAAYRLDPSDSAWSRIPPMLAARVRPTTARLENGDVLVAAGFGDACAGTIGYSCAPLASAEIFDPATDTWSLTAPLPAPAGGASATLLSGGDVLLVGGAASSGYDYNGTPHVDRYDSAAHTWSALPPAPFTITGSTLLPLPGNHAIALGADSEAGFDGSLGTAGSAPLSDCDSMPEIYSPARNTWTPAPPLPGDPISDSCTANAALVGDGQIFYDTQTGYDVLDAKQRCWTKIPSPPAEHAGIITPLTGGGVLDVASDDSGVSPWHGSETYTPATERCNLAQQIASRLFADSAPQGHGALISTILKTGYQASIQTIRPGRLTLQWYANIPTEDTTERVLIAADHAVTARVGATMDLRLTPTRHGRELLENNDLLKVMARATLTTTSHNTITSSRPFRLSR